MEQPPENASDKELLDWLRATQSIAGTTLDGMIRMADSAIRECGATVSQVNTGVEGYLEKPERLRAAPDDKIRAIMLLAKIGIGSILIWRAERIAETVKSDS